MVLIDRGRNSKRNKTDRAERQRQNAQSIGAAMVGSRTERRETTGVQLAHTCIVAAAIRRGLGTCRIDHFRRIHTFPFI